MPDANAVIKIAADYTDPFIFVSYCHDDLKEYGIINELLLFLASKGYHIWFDGGTGYGESIDDKVKEMIMSSSLVIAFVSPGSINKNKHWVEDEMTFARNQKKPLLPLYLKKTEIPSKLEKILPKNPLNFNVWEYDANVLKANLIIAVEKHLPPPSTTQQTDTLGQNISSDIPNNWQATIATRLVQVGDKEPAPDWLAQLPIPEESDLPETIRHLIADLLIDRLERFPDDMENTQAWFKSLLCLPEQQHNQPDSQTSIITGLSQR